MSSNPYIGAAVIHGLVELATIIQVPLAILAVIRAGPSHRLPYIILLPTLLCLFIGYATQLALDIFWLGYRIPDRLAATICNLIFFSLSDPLMFLFLMLLIIDRMRTTAVSATKGDATPAKNTQLLTVITYLIGGLMAIFALAWSGLEGSAQSRRFKRITTVSQYQKEMESALQLSRTFWAFYLLGTIVIVVSAIRLHFALKKNGQSDKISSALIISTPFLAIAALNMLVRLIILGVDANYNRYAVLITGALLHGPLYAVVIFLLIFAPILHPDRKGKLPGPVGQHWAPPGQYGAYGSPFGPPMQQQWGTQPGQMQPGFIPPQPQFGYSVPQHPYAYPHYLQQGQPIPSQSTSSVQPQALPLAQASSSQATSNPASDSPVPSSSVASTAPLKGTQVPDQVSGVDSANEERARMAEENAALRRRILELEGVGKKA